MKKFRILGIIAILCIIANAIGSFDEFWRGVQEGYEIGRKSEHTTAIPKNAFPVILKVEPSPETASDSLYNSRTNSQLPYQVSEVTTYTTQSTWDIVLMVLIFPATIYFLIGFCCLIRLLVSISRRNIFTSNNIFYARCFAYSNAILEILSAIWAWSTGSAAINQTVLPGYEIIDYSGTHTSWISIIIPILFAEIFAIALKMKEEQDLTI